MDVDISLVNRGGAAAFDLESRRRRGLRRGYSIETGARLRYMDLHRRYARSHLEPRRLFAARMQQKAQELKPDPRFNVANRRGGSRPSTGDEGGLEDGALSPSQRARLEATIKAGEGLDTEDDDDRNALRDLMDKYG